MEVVFELPLEAGDSVGREVEQAGQLGGQQQRVQSVCDAEDERPEDHVTHRVPCMQNNKHSR